MSSEQLKRHKISNKLLYSLFIAFILITGHLSPATGAIKDRVVAFVDDNAITLSELEVMYSVTKKITPDAAKEDVLNTMVNRLLLLREAKKIHLEAPSEDELVKEYIDLKIRAFIQIKDDDMMKFYEQHLSEFKGKEFDAVRDGIENYLVEDELNKRLKMHINDLRGKSCVKIQLNQDIGK